MHRVLDFAGPFIGEVPTYPPCDAALDALCDRYL